MESRRQPKKPRSRALTAKRRLGDAAEARACAWLERRGLELIERNFHCRFGEIDLVMRDRDTLVVVEVRCRGGNALTRAALTVDVHKQARLVRATQAFIAKHRQFETVPVRFDVIGIDEIPRRGMQPDWLKDAFRPGA